MIHFTGAVVKVLIKLGFRSPISVDAAPSLLPVAAAAVELRLAESSFDG